MCFALLSGSLHPLLQVDCLRVRTANGKGIHPPRIFGPIELGTLRVVTIAAAVVGSFVATHGLWGDSLPSKTTTNPTDAEFFSVLVNLWYVYMLLPQLPF